MINHIKQTVVCAAVALLIGGQAVQADDAKDKALRDAALFYASFDEQIKGDYGGGGLTLSTRMDGKEKKEDYVFTKGFNDKVFRVARNKGVHGGALEAVDVLPRRGRIFFPAKGNIGYKPGGWGGAVSFWINMNPNTMLKTGFCDPVQITHRGAHNGGLWCDFPNTKPRDFRMGIFPGLTEGEKPLKESDPAASLIRLKKIEFKQGKWQHVLMNWNHFDTGKPNAQAELYIDGRLRGKLTDRQLAMQWEIDKVGIYVAVSLIGMMDELAVFRRPLTAEEISQLADEPSLLTPLKSRKDQASLAPGIDALAPVLAEKPTGDPPAPPNFPFAADEASAYQAAYARWSGLPLELTCPLGTRLVLVPPGKFLMGSPEKEPGHKQSNYDETRHEVTLTRPFYLSRTETTVDAFRRFVAATSYVTDGERNGGGNAHDARAVWKHRPGTQWRKPGYAGPYQLEADHPVVHVSHTDCLAFCKWLNRRLPQSASAGLKFDLPAEAQWEWACRAGSGARYSWGEDVDRTGKVINVGDKSLRRVHPEWPRETMPMDDAHAFCAPVGSYRPNGFGLCDMLGNVWEFCSTRYADYPRSSVIDPAPNDPKRGFAVRGGGWSNQPNDARCATRNADPPHFCHSNLGFRLVLKLPSQ